MAAVITPSSPSALLTLPHLQGHDLPPAPQTPALVISPVAFLASCVHFSEFSWHLQFLSHWNSCNCNKCIPRLEVVYKFFPFSCLLYMWYDHENTHNIWMHKRLTNCVKGLHSKKAHRIDKIQQNIQNYTLCLLDKFYTFHACSFLCMCAIS